jgi:hypothetical protein
MIMMIWVYHSLWVIRKFNRGIECTATMRLNEMNYAAHKVVNYVNASILVVLGHDWF